MGVQIAWVSLLVASCLAAGQPDNPSGNNWKMAYGQEDASSCNVIYQNYYRGETDRCEKAKDCSDVARSGKVRSGVYRVWPEGLSCGLDVYCDLEEDGGGWTVIQRRGRYGNPKDYFFRRWRDYKFGFGKNNEDFWIGNDNLYHLSNQDNYVLRVNLKDDKGEMRNAQYDEFYIEDEINKYRLWVDVYKGDAGDSMARHNGQFFSTIDRKNENSQTENCAKKYKGGWWYAAACHLANLNGLYLDGNHTSFADGVNWMTWNGFYYSFPYAEMKIRPKFYSSKTD